MRAPQIRDASEFASMPGRMIPDTRVTVFDHFGQGNRVKEFVTKG
jgi:hypothetical protein